jgi:hypothetical protein
MADPIRRGDIVMLRDHVFFAGKGGELNHHENHDRPAVVMAEGMLCSGQQFCTVLWSEDEGAGCLGVDLRKIGSIWDLPFPEALTQKGDASDGAL